MRRWVEALTTTLPLAVGGTLICCALPIALVAVGAGSVVATMVETAPWVVALSRHKEWMFLGVGALLGVNYWALYHSRAAACRPGGACHPERPLGRWLRRGYWASVGLFAIGVGAAYLSLPIAQALGY